MWAGRGSSKPPLDPPLKPQQEYRLDIFWGAWTTVALAMNSHEKILLGLYLADWHSLLCGDGHVMCEMFSELDQWYKRSILYMWPLTLTVRWGEHNKCTGVSHLGALVWTICRIGHIDILSILTYYTHQTLK